LKRYFNTFKNKDIFDKVLGKEAIAVLSRKFKIDFFCNYDCDVIRWTEEKKQVKDIVWVHSIYKFESNSYGKNQQSFYFKKIIIYIVHKTQQTQLSFNKKIYLNGLF
jgi:hypothetical protein